MELPAWPRRTALIPVLVALAATVACGGGAEPAPVAVGAGDTAESVLLAEIYAGALGRAGVAAEVVPAPGDRAARVAALDAGRVDLLADHTAALARFFDTAALDQGAVPTPGTPAPGDGPGGVAPDSGPADPTGTAAVTAALARSLPQGLVVSDPADGTDLRPRLLVTAESARRDTLAAADDPADVCTGRTAGTAPVPGLLDPAPPAALPGCAPVTTVAFPDPASLREALLTGAVQVGLLAGPAPAAVITGLAAVSGAGELPAENVVPLFRDGILDDRGREKLNYVAGELTTDELITLVWRVAAGEPATDLARAWLDAHAL